MSLSEDLRRLFMFFQTSNLSGVTVQEFRSTIESRIGEIDGQLEGFSNYEIDRQRDLSVKFHWGHDHDFGEFMVRGRMGERHITVLANFIAIFPITLNDFKSKQVFDIGCWTGGTTLLLSTLAESVFAIEEVKKYSDMASYLAKSFGVDDHVSVETLSIYDCNTDSFYDRFDIVFFPGVIYHLSDPLIALRILYNSLRVGGVILVESEGLNLKEPYCEFEGSLEHRSGTQEMLNRSGWNWFIPSPSALNRWMKEAGFDEIHTVWHNDTNRAYGFGRKNKEIGICRAGLSFPHIK